MPLAADRSPDAPPPVKAFAPAIGHNRPDEEDGYDATLARRQRYLSPALKTFQAFDTPLMLVRGEGQYLWDESGRKYLDCLAQNLCISVGYNHPEVTEAVMRQAQTLQHATTMFFNPVPARFAEELVGWMPAGVEWGVHLVNSGAEAIDLAVLMARAFTRNFDVIALRNSFHGLHGVGQALTGLSSCTQAVPAPAGFVHAMHPDTYRGAFGTDVAAYVREFKVTIDFATSGAVAATIIEPIQGFGGVIAMPDGYLRAAFDMTRAAGGLCIADEIQTGFARTGRHKWGFEDHGVTPDIVVMAKGIGNGYPLAAVVARREIMQAMCDRKFFNTFGSNLVSCAAGRAVLRAIEAQDLQANARVMGARFMAELLRAKDRWDIVGDVRGQGLMLAAELVRDRATKEPADREAARMHHLLRDEGVIVGLSGFHKNVLRICPPLVVDGADADFFGQALDRAFARLDQER